MKKKSNIEYEVALSEKLSNSSDPADRALVDWLALGIEPLALNTNSLAHARRIAREGTAADKLSVANRTATLSGVYQAILHRRARRQQP